MSIDKKLHWIWYDFGSGPDLPEKYKNNRKTWIDKHPDFEHRLWNQKEVELLITSHYPQFLSFYRKLKYPVQQVDAAKCFILHHEGGCYIDTDMKCKRSIHPLLNKSIRLVKSRYGPLINCFMMSKQRNNFWIDHLNDMKTISPLTGPLSCISKYGTIMITTGPILLSYTAKRHKIIGEEAKLFSVKEEDADKNAFCTHDGDNNWFNWQEEHKKIIVIGLLVISIMIFIIFLIVCLTVRRNRRKRRNKELRELYLTI